jgi:hypothetical protein
VLSKENTFLNLRNEGVLGIICYSESKGWAWRDSTKLVWMKPAKDSGAKNKFFMKVLAHWA